MGEELKTPASSDVSRLSRRRFLTKGAIGVGVLGGLGTLNAAAASGAKTYSRRTERARAGRTIMWVVDCVGAWNLQIDVGFHDAATMTGWTYKKIGAPCAKASPTSNIEILEQAMQLKPDAIAAPMWFPQIAPTLKKIKDDGIMLMMNQGEIAKYRRELQVPFIGQDEVKGGVLIGNALSEALANSGKKSGVIVGGNHTPGGQIPIQRLGGAKTGIAQFNKEHGTSFTYQEIVDNSQADPGKAVTIYKAKIRQLGSKLVGLLAPGGETNAPIQLQALKELNIKPGKVTIGSWDTGPRINAGIQTGYIAVTLDQELYAQGFLPGFLAWEELERGFPARDASTGLVLVDKGNLEEAIARDKQMASLGKKYKVVLG